MPLGEDLQREWKARLLRDALSRIGGLETDFVKEIRRPVSNFHYRNRMEFTLAAGDSGGPAFGLHTAYIESGVVDVDRCMLEHEEANVLLASVRELILDSPSVRRVLEREGASFRITIRRSWKNGRMLLILGETSAMFPAARDLARQLRKRHPELCGVLRLRSIAGRRGGSTLATLSGRPWLEERVGEITFRIGGSMFFQVSTPGAAELVRLVSHCAGDFLGECVLDLYGGVGLFGLSLLHAGAGEVIVCDADAEAISCGRWTTRRLGGKRAKFLRADAGRFMKEKWSECDETDLVIADPPRAGLHPEVTAQLLRRRPKRVVLVSCDPATLARDLRSLVRGGYGVRKLIPVDIFPQTAHLETVALLVG
jgi:23S rRNA (uracil1939-C5)-methyltransferase